MSNGSSEWVNRPGLHHARIGLAGATVDELILAIGGFDSTETGFVIFDFVEARRTEGSGHWRDLPVLPTPRANLSAADLNGFVYAVGGFGFAVEGSVQTLDVVERYDPQLSSWAASPSLPVPRAAPGVVGFGDLLYVAGGEIPHGNTSVVSDSVISFSPESGEWNLLAPMPTRRSRLRLVAAGDHLYAIGGVAQGGQALEIVESYDPDSNTWDPVASMNESRLLPGAVAIDSGHIVVVGGDSGGTHSLVTQRSTEVYDVVNDQWRVLGALLPHGRVSLVSALEDDGTVLAIGGAVSNGGPPPPATNLVEGLDPQNLTQ